MMTDVTPIGDFFLCQDSELGVILRKKVLGAGIFWGLGSLKKFTSALLSSSSLSLRSRIVVCGGRPFVNSFLLGGCLLLLLPPPPQLLPTEEEGIDK